MRVILADDSILLREGVARLLSDAGFAVLAQAGDAEELLTAVVADPPDVAITDIRMPPTHTDEGLRAAHRIRAEHPGVGVLVLSQYVETDYAVDLVADGAGGLGYLLKDRVANVQEFTDAVRRIGAGGSVIDPEVVSRLVGRARQANPLDALSEREREVLALMAEGRSNQAISERMFLSAKTVEGHVRNIFTKLNLSNRTGRPSSGPGRADVPPFVERRAGRRQNPHGHRVKSEAWIEPATHALAKCLSACHTSRLQERSEDEGAQGGHVQSYPDAVQPIPPSTEGTPVLDRGLRCELEDSIVDGNVSHQGDGEHQDETAGCGHGEPEGRRGPISDENGHDDRRRDREHHDCGHDPSEVAAQCLFGLKIRVERKGVQGRMDNEPASNLVSDEQGHYQQVHESSDAEGGHRQSSSAHRALARSITSDLRLVERRWPVLPSRRGWRRPRTAR